MVMDVIQDPSMNTGASILRRGVQLNAPTGLGGKTDPALRRPSGRRVRSDALPEHSDFQDGGCSLSPTCLRCPLARCRYDEPGGARRMIKGSRDVAVQAFRDDGLAIDTLAQQFGLSRRTVFRILARGRKRQGSEDRVTSASTRRSALASRRVTRRPCASACSPPGDHRLGSAPWSYASTAGPSRRRMRYRMPAAIRGATRTRMRTMRIRMSMAGLAALL